MMRRGIVEKLAQKCGVEHWRSLAGQARKMKLSALTVETDRARELRFHLDEVIAVGDDRLAYPRSGTNVLQTPHGTDWSWRPEVWRHGLAEPGKASFQNRSTLGQEIKMFHDCPLAELVLKQFRSTMPTDVSPYGLSLEVFHFRGSFLSLVIDLPSDALEGLEKRHLIRMTSEIEMERSIGMYARLNIKSGPNTEEIVREIPRDGRERVVEFDLAHTQIDESRLEGAWVDLFFEDPRMSRTAIRDLSFSRSPRAEF